MLKYLRGLFIKLFYTKVFPDGSIVSFSNNRLEINNSKETTVILNGKVNLLSEDEICIQSLKTLRLRGDTVHINDHKPAENKEKHVNYPEIIEFDSNNNLISELSNKYVYLEPTEENDEFRN